MSATASQIASHLFHNTLKAPLYGISTKWPCGPAVEGRKFEQDRMTKTEWQIFLTWASVFAVTIGGWCGTRWPCSRLGCWIGRHLSDEWQSIRTMPLATLLSPF